MDQEEEDDDDDGGESQQATCLLPDAQAVGVSSQVGRGMGRKTSPRCSMPKPENYTATRNGVKIEEVEGDRLETHHHR